MKYIKLCIVAAAVITGFLCGCSDVNDEIKVRIIANGANFSGWYDVDGDITIVSGGAASSSVYSYEVTLEDIEDVEFDVITSGDAYSLTVTVYRDDEKVKSSSTTSSSSDGEQLHINLTYSIGEESSDDSSSE